MSFDFKGINNSAMSKIRTLLEVWLPEGKYQGNEYVAINPTRADSKTGSFKINTSTAKWSDFAEGDNAQGGDLISLKKYLEGLPSQKAAAIALAEEIGLEIKETRRAKKKALTKSWTPIIPIPKNAPENQHRHKTLGLPSMTWTYCDEDGHPVFKTCRFNMRDGGKSVLPRTFCDDGRGNRAWKWKALPDLRPLYGLEILSANSTSKPVLIGEGEKTADATRKVLSDDMTVLTWAGGSKALHKTDWMPLKGATVLIWPDADKPGYEAAMKIAELAVIAEARSVEIVAPPEDVDSGWDLADDPNLDRQWVLDWIEANKLSRKAFKSVALEQYEIADSPQKANSSSGPFKSKDDGVYYLELDSDGNLIEERICSPLDVLALTRNTDNKNWGRNLQVVDLDGKKHQWAMQMDLTAGNGDVYRQHLLGLGLRIAAGGRVKNLLHKYLTETTPADRARCVNRTGWHGNEFVLHDITYGRGNGEKTILQGLFNENPYKCSGTLKEWQDSIGLLCKGNSRLEFAVSLGFAAPMQYLAGAESGGFNLVGPSSIGKTTILKAAASVCGGGDDAGYIRSWRATDNDVEAIATSHCDTLLCLDEMGQASSKVVAESAYLLANGQGKIRATKYGTESPTNTWRSSFISTGEVSLETKIQEDARLRARAGQTVRVVDIDANAGGKYGAFETTHDLETGDKFAQTISSASRTYYGTPLRTFLEAVTENIDEVRTRHKQLLKTFYDTHCPDEADGQVTRVCRRIAHVAAAGELATEMGILPWNGGAASKAALACFHSWLDFRGGTGAAEERKAIEQVRAFFEKHGSTRFELGDDFARANLKDNSSNPTIVDKHNRAGFKIEDPASQDSEYWVLPEVYKKEVCEGFDYRMVCRALIAKGIMTTNPNVYTMNKRLPGMGTYNQKKVFVINSTIFAG